MLHVRRQFTEQQAHLMANISGGSDENLTGTNQGESHLFFNALFLPFSQIVSVFYKSKLYSSIHEAELSAKYPQMNSLDRLK